MNAAQISIVLVVGILVMNDINYLIWAKKAIQTRLGLFFRMVCIHCRLLHLHHWHKEDCRELLSKSWRTLRKMLVTPLSHGRLD